MVDAYVPNENMSIHRHLDWPTLWTISHKSGYALATVKGLNSANSLAKKLNDLACWDFCTKEDMLFKEQTFQEVLKCIKNHGVI